MQWVISYKIAVFLRGMKCKSWRGVVHRNSLDDMLAMPLISRNPILPNSDVVAAQKEKISYLQCIIAYNYKFKFSKCSACIAKTLIRGCNADVYFVNIGSEIETSAGSQILRPLDLYESLFLCCFLIRFCWKEIRRTSSTVVYPVDQYWQIGLEKYSYFMNIILNINTMFYHMIFFSFQVSTLQYVTLPYVHNFILVHQ